VGDLEWRQLERKVGSRAIPKHGWLLASDWYRDGRLFEPAYASCFPHRSQTPTYHQTERSWSVLQLIL